MKQGYSVLLISDGTFMDDLIAAKMMNDDKKNSIAYYIPQSK